MNAPLKAIESTDKLEATMREIGRAARQGGARASRWRRRRRRTGARRHGQGHPPGAAGNSCRQRRRRGRGEVRRRDTCLPRPADARRRARSRPWRPVSTSSASSRTRSGPSWPSWRRPNGMRIERVRVPLGVIGVIYESRPNVTADAGALCLKAGNAAILRGGSESFRSARAIHAALVEGLARSRAAGGRDLAGADARPRRGRA